MEQLRNPYKITCVMLHDDYSYQLDETMYLNNEELEEMRYGINTIINTLITNDSVNASLSFHDENNKRKTYALTKIIYLYTDIDINIQPKEND